MSKARAVHTLESLHARVIEEGECWLWQGYLQNNTPQIAHYIDGKKTMVSVRKLLRELDTGKPQPKGHYANTCGECRCVNPDHTIYRSQDAHMRTMGRGKSSLTKAAKLREYRISTGQAKLSESKAQEIRLSDDSGPVLAERFGVSRGLINRIKRGRAWRVLSSPWQGLFR
jgi:hypothetical protein